MLFRKDIQKDCAYCVHAGKIDDETLICAKKGIVLSGSHCRRFQYDPLKRVPSRMKPQDFRSYDEVDFSL